MNIKMFDNEIIAYISTLYNDQNANDEQHFNQQVNKRKLHPGVSIIYTSGC